MEVLLEKARKYITSRYYLGYFEDIQSSEQMEKNWSRRSNKQYDIVNAVASNLSDKGDALIAFLTKGATVPVYYLAALTQRNEEKRIWSNEELLRKLGRHW